MTVSGLTAIDATVLVGVPTAALLILGLLVRDARDLGARRRPRRAWRLRNLVPLALGVVFVLVLVARFLLLT
jgi:hypothetical protein